jgi:hypothetical protein
MINSTTASFSFEDPITVFPGLTGLQPYIAAEVVSESGETCWGRLLCEWHEKKGDGQVLTHTYAAVIDGQDGGIYFDCSPAKIFAKCVVQLFVRPLFTLAKTIYYLSLYPIFAEVGKYYQRDQSFQEMKVNIIRASLDIVRTPLYGAILIIASVAVIITGMANPYRLYEGRKFLGQIEQAANWGEIHTFLTLADCFQPFPLEMLEWYASKDREDTDYGNLTLVERGLCNFARACIRRKRRRFDFFSCQKISPTIPYTSPILTRYDETERCAQT